MTDTRWDDARAIAFAAARPLPSERVPIGHCAERTLALPATARCDLPGFDTAAMDGWAVNGDSPWRVAGEILAGSTTPVTLERGTAVSIATGAPVPEGATAVVRSEQGRIKDGFLVGAPHAGDHIRPRGEECRSGEVLAGSGTVVSPALAGLLAAAGHDWLAVARTPRVRLLLLGDELLDSGIPTPGLVRDSLGPQLPGWIARMGAAVVEILRIPDTVPDLVAALRTTAAGTDLVVTTGGTAAGPVDCLHESIRGLGGQFLVDTVAVRPGHPMVLARVPESHGSLLLGLPGNPQSAVVGLMTLGQPAIWSMLGRAIQPLAPITALSDLTAPAAENRLVAGTRTDSAFHPGDHLGSAMLRGLAAATGFAVVPPGGAKTGEQMRWLPLP